MINKKLTRIVKWGSIGDLNKQGGYRTRKSGDFFVSILWGTIARNTQNTCKHPCMFSESPTNSYFGEITKKQGGLNE